MNGWIFTAIAVFLGVGAVFALRKAWPTAKRHRRDHRRYDDAHCYELNRKARLLGTIPSEADQDRAPFERDAVSELGPSPIIDLDDGAPDHGLYVDEREYDYDERKYRRRRPERSDYELHKHHEDLEREQDREDRENRERENRLHRESEQAQQQQAQEEFIEQLPIEQRVAHEMVEFHRQERQFSPHTNIAAVEAKVAEALHYMRLLNEAYGWEPGGVNGAPIADRMFNTNVMAVIAEARNTKTVSFRFEKMVSTMQSFALAAHIGSSEVAQAAATRVLLGSARMDTGNLDTLKEAREYFGAEFAEATGWIDEMDRNEEIVAARKLGIAPSAPSRADLEPNSIDIDHSKMEHEFERKGHTLF